MKAKTEDQTLRSYMGLDSQSKAVFYQRWTELLHYKTIATYSVRILNANAALSDLVDVLKNIVEGRLSPKNIEHSWSEAASKISRHLKYNVGHSGFLAAQEVLKRQPRQKSSNMGEFRRLHNTLSPLSQKIAASHARYLIEQIEEAFACDEPDATLFFSEELASELIWTGFHRDWLYTETMSQFRGKDWPFQDKWMAFRGCCLRGKRSMTAIVPLDSIPVELHSAGDFADFQCVTREEMVKSYAPSKFSPSSPGPFALIDLECYDPQSAAIEAFNQVAEHFETAGLFVDRDNLRVIAPVPIYILEESSTGSSLIPEVSHTRSRPVKNKEQMELLSGVVAGLPSKDAEHFRRALQYYRLSLLTHLPEAKLMNAWIGLESFVGSSKEVMEYVPAILTRNYIYELLRNFLLDCVNRDPQRPVDSSLVEQLLRKIQTKDDLVGAVSDVTSSHTTLRMRLNQIRKGLANGKATADLLATHQSNLSWHLQRIYRIRNLIAHFGLSHPQIGMCATHLQEYLHKVLLSVAYSIRSGNAMSPQGAISVLYHDRVSTDKHLTNSLSSLTPEIVLRGTVLR